MRREIDAAVTPHSKPITLAFAAISPLAFFCAAADAAAPPPRERRCFRLPLPPLISHYWR